MKIDRLFLIGAWETVLRLLELGPLDVLGPKCASSACVAPGRVRVWPPTPGCSPPLFCERCADWALRIAPARRDSSRWTVR